MSTRPELPAAPEKFYDESEAKLSERALELLALPEDGVPRFLLDIGCGSGLSGKTLSENGHQWIGLDISASMLNVAVEREVEGDLLLGDMGQGLGLRAGGIDGAISISAVQWLCNADKSSHEPRSRLKAFFGSLYRCLSRGARAVFQVYPRSIAQRELILCQAFQAGFGGGLVVDNPHSLKDEFKDSWHVVEDYTFSFLHATLHALSACSPLMKLVERIATQAIAKTKFPTLAAFCEFTSISLWRLLPTTELIHLMGTIAHMLEERMENG